MAKLSSHYKGIDIATRIKTASGRAIVSFAENVSTETKRVTHVKYGTLRRSVHAAPSGYDGGDDEERADKVDLQLTFGEVEATQEADGSVVEVGSWLSYACAEWVGRGHPGITQGLENARPKIHALVHQAFAEEGLL